MKVGDKVVCVDDLFQQRETAERFGVRYPVRGAMYTIRNVRKGVDGLAIQLMEIVNPILNYTYHGKDEHGFYAYRFRPIDYSFGEKVCEEIVKQTEELVCQH